MNNLWRKSFMAGILSVSLTAGAVTPAFASAAPDGKTDAASLAGGMGISQNWESWKTEWEAVKNDWTQVSLTPGSDFSQLNFAWYSKKYKHGKKPCYRKKCIGNCETCKDCL